jgi:hypothetical protein
MVNEYLIGTGDAGNICLLRVGIGLGIIEFALLGELVHIGRYDLRGMERVLDDAALLELVMPIGVSIQMRHLLVGVESEDRCKAHCYSARRIDRSDGSQFGRVVAVVRAHNDRLVVGIDGSDDWVVGHIGKRLAQFRHPRHNLGDRVLGSRTNINSCISTET